MAAKQDTLNPFYREVARYLRENGIRSVAHVPKVLPDDSVLVHNFARFPGTSRALGHNGFRAWLQRDAARGWNHAIAISRRSSGRITAWCADRVAYRFSCR
jgi:hypothetical protein